MMDLTPESSAPSESNNDSMSLWDSEGKALDQEDILQDLTADMDAVDLNVNASLVLELSDAVLGYREHSISTSISNAQAMAMQDMLKAQDTLGDMLWWLQLLKVDDETLALYTPRFLQPRVFGELSSPELINFESNTIDNTEVASFLTPAVREDGFKLLALLRQKKETRKPSYGIQ